MTLSDDYSEWFCPRCNFPNSGESYLCHDCSYNRNEHTEPQRIVIVVPQYEPRSTPERLPKEKPLTKAQLREQQAELRAFTKWLRAGLKRKKPSQTLTYEQKMKMFNKVISKRAKKKSKRAKK